VKALSGGERNRLLLARLFTRPANVLVLDEPTNDLDLETLELLEAQLVSWPGTLLLVSHDRRFMDNVITSTLVFEGEGRIGEYVGGYDDWRRASIASGAGSRESGMGQAIGPTRSTAGSGKDAGTAKITVGSDRETGGTAHDVMAPPSRRRLSFKEQRELDGLPARIEGLEAEQVRLNAEVSSPDFYRKPATEIHAVMARLEALPAELDEALRRWDELDSSHR
jgi:ATP-binding cassette subfamily F protein uup